MGMAIIAQGELKDINRQPGHTLVAGAVMGGCQQSLSTPVIIERA